MRGQVYYHVAKALTTFYNAVGPTTYRAKLLGMFGTLDIVNAIQKMAHIVREVKTRQGTDTLLDGWSVISPATGVATGGFPPPKLMLPRMQ